MRFKATEIATLSVAGIALIGSIASAAFAWTSRNRELDIELVKIGVAILRAEPKEEQTTGAREWAIDVIEAYSRRSFSADARAQLLKKKLDVQGTTFGGLDDGWGAVIFGSRDRWGGTPWGEPPPGKAPARPEKN